MFTKDLAEIASSRGVTVNCLDPGTVNTKMLDAGWGMCGISIKVLLPSLCYCFLNDLVAMLQDNMLSRWPKTHLDRLYNALQDANDEYKMLTDPAMDNVTGQYRVSHRPRSMARVAEDKATRDRLWKTLEEQTGAQWPERH